MIYLPNETIKEQRGKAYPALYFLAGLTSNHENAPIKTHFGAYAKKHNIAMIFPDTAPRGVEIEGMKDNWWFGESAGYYVDATTEKWSKNFNMNSYITQELPKLVSDHFHVDSNRSSLTGFSMGGMGALALYLRNPGKYRSVSCFSPIAHPTNMDWGKNAFEQYLGSVEAGKAYDPTLLVADYTGPKTRILMDQGSHDKFLANLQPE
jgi:S-formylglutathione hydrolase